MTDFAVWNIEAEYAHYIPWSGVPILAFRECLTCHALVMASLEGTRDHIEWHEKQGHEIAIRKNASFVTETGDSRATGGKRD